MAVIVISDLVDGRLARKLGTAGSRGALIDAGCDAIVVLTAACVLGVGDPRYLWIAALMAMAFVSYGAYSLVIRTFAYTRLGRYDGALCYALVAAAALRPWFALAGITAPEAWEWALIAPVAAFLAISTAENIAGALPWLREKGRDGLHIQSKLDGDLRDSQTLLL